MSLRHVSVLLSLLLLVSPLHSANDWLAAQRWQQRLVLVTGFDSPADTAALGKQLERLQEALGERRISIWRVEGEQAVWLGGAAPLDVAALPPAADALVSQLKLDKRGLHLIGLDGGLKALRREPEQLQTLIDAVDSMPMRVQEMQRDPGRRSP